MTGQAQDLSSRRNYGATWHIAGLPAGKRCGRHSPRSIVYGINDDKLGKITDVVFNHASGDILYVVVDTGGWLSTKEFIVPAERIRVIDQARKRL